MLCWCVSANDWDIVRDGSGVERPVSQEGPGFSLKPAAQLDMLLTITSLLGEMLVPLA